MKPLPLCHTLQNHVNEIKNGCRIVESTNYGGDGQIVRNDTLVMSRFDGGYFDYDGKPHYYLTDWQGNNIGVFDRNGSMEQQVDYYPYGEPRIEPRYSQKKNVNRHLFGNKERIVAGRLNEYDFMARTYVASQCRFTTLDPLAEKTPWLSPYAYCAGNPVNFIDPDGRHTRVWKNANGEYQIFGGNIDDDDLNIYEYLQDENGDYTIRGNSIGVTTSLTSFYDSDKVEWADKSIIDIGDKSGMKFLDFIYNRTPDLYDYMINGYGGQLYDFKASNFQKEHVGPGNSVEDIYRGMPVEVREDGVVVYSSARDIGNIAAGYVAGVNAVPWNIARDVFDTLQTIQDLKSNKPLGFKHEGKSSQNAQFLGWEKGYYGTSLDRKMFNWFRARGSGPKYTLKKILGL